MKLRLLLLCLFCGSLFAYQDEELQQLWNSIPDICHPTQTDFQKIERYLNEGERPYLDLLRERAYVADANTRRRLVNILNFKLLGPKHEMPLFEIHHLNVREETKNRCILLYGSYNGIYPQKTRKVLEELKACGYSGDVLMRIGSFPNVENGGLKLCHVPYAFKVTFLQEARARGYNEVLWIDTCMHPLTDLETIFSKIRKHGYFFTYAGKLRDNQPNHLLEAAHVLGIGQEEYDTILHVCSGVLGLNMEHPKALQLLEEWAAETERVYPNITWFPEELSLSAVVSRLKLQADGWLGMRVCNEHEAEELRFIRPTLQFYCENVRE